MMARVEVALDYKCRGTYRNVRPMCLSVPSHKTNSNSNKSFMLDIEMDPPEAPSGAKRALSPLLLSTTTTKRVKLNVPQDQLTSLNARLNRWSRSGLWPTRLQQASENPPDMTFLISSILMDILFALAETDIKDDFISPLSPNQADRFVEGFNIDERREWEDGIKMCMESGDWSDLITHRMYAVTLQDVFFDHGHSETSALQPVAITPNKASPSSETTCVSMRFCRW